MYVRECSENGDQEDFCHSYLLKKMLILDGIICKHKPILPFLLRVRSLGRDRKSGRLAGKLMTIKRRPRRRS